jgi:5-methyltetrahydrofolate--homocysteine methyltransferase
MAEVFTTTVGSSSKQVSISRDLPTVIIGERINPTGRKKLQEELKAGNFDTVKADALAQIEAGAAILHIGRQCRCAGGRRTSVAGTDG